MADASNKVQHDLIPEHEKLTDEEKQAFLDEYEISMRELPKIKQDDPAIQHLDVEPNDVIKIHRESSTAGQTKYYRGVIDE
jgi:DNA-directed RNA polymerase subunit H